MRSFGIVEDEVVNKFFSETRQIIDEMEVIVDEFFLKGPVKSFNTAVYLWTAWIGKEVGYPFMFQIGVKLPQELGTIVGLQGSDG